MRTFKPLRLPHLEVGNIDPQLRFQTPLVPVSTAIDATPSKDLTETLKFLSQGPFPRQQPGITNSQPLSTNQRGTALTATIANYTTARHFPKLTTTYALILIYQPIAYA